jgi:hypothetical protein
MSPLYRFLIYFFPFPLGVIEWLIRASFSDATAAEFFAPSLCSAALALLLPVIVPKAVSSAELSLPTDFRIAPNLTLRKVRDERVVAVGVITLIMGIAAWAACLYLSVGGAAPGFIKSWGSAHELKLWIAFIMYFSVTGMTEWKART